jgi:hypothetical protein
VSVPEWLGDVPTWIGAGGAIGAAWFAYQTITSQRQQIGEQQAFIAEQSRFMDEQRQNLELERAELRAAAADRRRAQAQQVEMKDKLVPVGTEGAALRSVAVTNFSNAPIHNVEVRFGTAYTAHEVHELVESPYGAQLAERDNRLLGERWMTPLHLLGSGRAASFRSQAWPEASAHNNRPTLFFTDDDGVRWSLDTYGKLEEVSPEGG